MTRVHALSALVVFLAACAPETVSLRASDESAAPASAAAPAAAAAPAREAGGEDPKPRAFRITGLVWQAGYLRAGPGADHAAVATVAANTPVTVLATRNTWYRVKLDRTGGPTEGWIPFDRVAVDSPVGDGPALALGAVIVKAVNLRAGPSISTAVAARLPGRTPVTILGRRENWYRVSAARDGVSMGGWVRADFAVVDVATARAAEPTAPTAGQVVRKPPRQIPAAARSQGAETNPLSQFLAELGAQDAPRPAASVALPGGGLGSLAPAGETAGTPAGGCGGDIGGTWESASRRTTLDLDAASETGALESRQGRYRAVTPFTWSATADSITVTYTGQTRFYETGTGKKVDFEKDSKGGTVHCAFTGDSLTVGGVAYRRQ